MEAFVAGVFLFAWSLGRLKYLNPELFNSGSLIVNFGSDAGLDGMELQAGYAAAKEAIRCVVTLIREY